MPCNAHCGYYYKGRKNGYLRGKAGTYNWDGALKGDFREAGKVIVLNPIGDYKGACLIVLHQAIHLFFTDVLFCNKKFSFNSRLPGHLNISTTNKDLVCFQFSSLMQ